MPLLTDDAYRALCLRASAAELEVARLRAVLARVARECALADPRAPVGRAPAVVGEGSSPSAYRFDPPGPRVLSDLAAVERIGREVAAGEPEPFPEAR